MGGLGYAGNELEQFKEVSDYLYEKIDEFVLDGMPEAGKDLLATLQNDPAKFRRMITISNSEDQTFKDTPIFCHIKAEDFLKALLNVPNKKKRIIGFAIKDRYKFSEVNQRIVSELPFLQKLKTLLCKDMEKRKETITGWILSEMLAKQLQEAIDKLKEVKIDDQI